MFEMLTVLGFFWVWKTTRDHFGTAGVRQGLLKGSKKTLVQGVVSLKMKTDGKASLSFTWWKTN